MKCWWTFVLLDRKWPALFWELLNKTRASVAQKLHKTKPGYCIKPSRRLHSLRTLISSNGMRKTSPYLRTSFKSLKRDTCWDLQLYSQEIQRTWGIFHRHSAGLKMFSSPCWYSRRKSRTNLQLRTNRAMWCRFFSAEIGVWIIRITSSEGLVVQIKSSLKRIKSRRLHLNIAIFHLLKYTVQKLIIVILEFFN